MTAAEVRQSFIDFFKAKGHEYVPSSPVVIPSDPTLLFANAGMNQFKEIFLGARKPDHTRVANTQKCIRVSGKHNDLEEVGRDTYHHTFFEMMGNWSFGDYYKQEAIEWAWELMTDVWKLPKDRLWATVYHSDDEAAELWRTCTDIPHDHILPFDEKDNFWEMGETGPCGPCSEIHIDLTENGCTPDMVNADSPEVIELWNLVFIQYNRKADKSLEDLPSKHVDTGMGFERIAATLQGKKSNYDSDVFTPYIEKLMAMSGRAYEGEDAVAMRVIADHIRTLTVAISDGVMPSNEGRGYVMRRLLRRAVRFGRKLGFEEPFMAELYPLVAESLGPVFPSILERKDIILPALRAEEESFAATLDRGISLFEEQVAAVKKSGGDTLPGEQVFRLYDTFGFPVDLTTLMAEEQGLGVDEDGFEACMNAQRERGRDARKGQDGAAADLMSGLIKEGLKSEFVGYDSLEASTTVLALSNGQDRLESLNAGDEGWILLNETPFYGESGGQLGDHGTLTGPSGIFQVTDTQKPVQGMILHIGTVSEGSLSSGETVTASVDADRRTKLAMHHSATHIMNWALRESVSDAIRQAGSLVAPDRLRFDFSHYEAVSAEQLETIERMVNEKIIQNDGVTTYEIPYAEVADSDIVAVFDEKYGDRVRVVDVAGYSKELCGGTHVDHVGRIGQFRILGESSIAAGVRRIEAVVGLDAFEAVAHDRAVLRTLSQQCSAGVDELSGRISQMLKQQKAMEKELKTLKSQAAKSGVDDLVNQVIECGGVSLLAATLEGQGADGLRDAQDALRKKLPDAVIVLGGAVGGKVSFIASAPKDLLEKGVHAGKLIGEIAKIAGGGGGGRPDKAQAGGKNPEKLPEAMDAVPGILAKQLG
jgi:alanyl-tRNA synthetase